MYLTYKGFAPELISTFRGDAQSGVLPHSGSYELFGGKGDLLFNTATLSAPVTLGSDAALSFWTWYEIEEYWDFGFVQISTDGGSTWTSLETENTTSDHDPGAISAVIDNVPGLTGSSGGWIQQTADLSAYASTSVMIRFLYVTDWAYTETGFYVDDIAITDVSGTLFSDDLESGSGNWSFNGWESTNGFTTNDWELTFINPLYDKGKFVEFDIFDGEADDPVNGYLVDYTSFSTNGLNSGVVTIIVSNHQPEVASFAAEYLLLVEKGNAKYK
jgi:hypothetical protein